MSLFSVLILLSSFGALFLAYTAFVFKQVNSIFNDKIEPIKKDMSHIKKDLNNHITDTNKKIDKLDTKIDSKFDKLDTKIDSKFDKLDTGQSEMKEQLIKLLDRNK